MLSPDDTTEKSVLGEEESTLSIQPQLATLALTSPANSPSFDTDLAMASLPPLLQPLYQAHRQRLKQNPELVQALAYFVTPDATLTRYSEARQPLAEVVANFLAEAGAPLLLLGGESGSGKSVYLNRLEQQAWQAMVAQEANARVPLFIDLKSLYQLPLGLNFVQYHLQQCGYTVEAQQRLRSDYRWVLLLDGYDELTGSLQGSDLYQQGQLASWQAPVLITCRSEYLGGEFASRFLGACSQGNNNNNARLLEGASTDSASTILSTLTPQSYFIAPFSPAQITYYLQQVTQERSAALEELSYEARLAALPSLQALIVSPLILRLVVEVLPELTLTAQAHITLAQIYAAFTERWFERESARLRLTEQVELPGSAFTAFSRALGFLMFLQGTPEVYYHAQDTVESKLTAEDTDDWALFFSTSQPTVQQLRQGAPLRCLGNGRYSFYHKSFMEYFAASYLYHEILQLETLDEATTQVLVKDLASLPVNFRLLTREPAVLRFLAEQIQMHPERPAQEARLWALVKASRQQPAVAVAAANAVTVLNAVGTALSGQDLSQTYLTGADLSYSLCDGTNFREAYLAEVDFTQAWLREADFSGSDLSSVHFGERPYLAHKRMVRSVVYSPDGRLVATAADRRIYLWDTQSGQRVKVLRGHKSTVTSVSWSPNGRSLASGSYDKTVRVWDTASGQARVWKGHKNWISSVSWSPDGHLLASGSNDHTVRVWDTASSQARVLEGHTDPVTSVSWSPDGCSLASAGGYYNMVRVWDTASGQARVWEGHADPVNSVSWSLDGRSLASGSNDKTIRVWDTASGQARVWEGHTGEVLSVSWSLDGRLLASGSYDKTIRVWDTASGQAQVWQGHTRAVNSVSWSLDGRLLASGSYDKTVRVWDTASGQARAWQGHTEAVNSVSWSPDCRSLASGSDDKTIWVWDTASGQARVWEGHAYMVLSVSWSPDGHLLASGSDDRTVRVWEVSSGQARVWRGHTKKVWSVSWSPDGCSLASCSEDKTVRVWDTASGQARVWEGDPWEVTSVSWSPDGRWLAVGSWSKVRVYDLTGGQVRVWETLSKWISTVSWSPDGRSLASGSSDNTVRVLDLASGQAQVWQGHTDRVISVSWSQDGHSLASGSKDNSVRVWDLASGRCLVFLQHQASVNAVAWLSPQHLAMGLANGEVQRWQAQPSSNGLQWRLIWKSHATLCCDALRLDSTLGLTDEQNRLLMQRGAVKPQRMASALSTTLPISLPLIMRPVQSKTPGFFKQTLNFMSRRSNTHLLAAVLPPLVDPAQNLWQRLGEADASHSAVTAVAAYIRQGGATTLKHPQTGQAPLAYAAERGDRSSVQCLLAASVNVDARDFAQCTALHSAVAHSQWAIVGELLTAGARTNLRDKDGHCPSDLLPATALSPLQAHVAQWLAEATQADNVADEAERSWSAQLTRELKDLQESAASSREAGLVRLRQVLEQAPLRAPARRQLEVRIAHWQNTQATLSPLPMRDVDLRLDLQGRLQHLRHSEDPYGHLVILIRCALQATPPLAADIVSALLTLLPDLALSPLELLKSPSDRTIWLARLKTDTSRTTLKANDPSLQAIQARLARWQGTAKTLTKLQAPIAISQALQALVERDQTFVRTLCEGTAATRQAALTPCLTLVTRGGAHYATPEVTQALHGLLIQGRKDNQSGLHGVIRHAGLYFKPEPHEPGAEMAVNQLSQLVGVQGTTHTELIKVSYQSRTWPVLVSKAIEGLHFGDYVNPRKKDHDAAALAQLQASGRLPYEPAGFAQAVLFALFTQPYDGKRDNYIAQAVGDLSAVPVQRKPIGIDNDLAFVTPIIRQANGEHVGQLCCFLLFEAQMNDPIPADVRQHWGRLSVETLLLNWLQGIQTQEQDARAWVKAGLFTEEELKDKIRVPLRFMPGRLAALYQIGCALQTALRDEAVLTLNDVFKRVHPLVYVYYQGIREKLNGSGQAFNSEQAYQFLHRQQATIYRGGQLDGNASLTLEAIRRDTQDPELRTLLQALPELLKQVGGEYGFFDFTHQRTLSSTEALAEALPVLAAATQQAPAKQRDILHGLIQWKRLAKLDLCGWSTLTDSDLTTLVRQNRKHIKILMLENNAAMTAEGLKSAFLLCPSVHLQLGLGTGLSVAVASELMDMSEHFSVRLSASKTLTLKQNGLVQILDEEECQALREVPFFNELAEQQGLGFTQSQRYRL